MKENKCRAEKLGKIINYDKLHSTVQTGDVVVNGERFAFFCELDAIAQSPMIYFNGWRFVLSWDEIVMLAEEKGLFNNLTPVAEQYKNEVDPQTSEALRIMCILGIKDQQITEFVKHNMVYLYENGERREIEEDSELWCKINELQAERGILVYSVTHEKFTFGECFSFLNVSKYEEDWNYEISHCKGNKYLVQAYVWNVTRPECSESGSVVIHSHDGILTRIG